MPNLTSRLIKSFHKTNSVHGSVLNIDTINQRIVETEYAVRGELAIRAEELKKQLKENPSSLPFPKVINCNIGNPQQLGQRPITFFRQVASLAEFPELLDDSKLAHCIGESYPKDAVDRAKLLLKEIGPIGAYTDSRGSFHVRKTVAEFIKKRDGYPTNPDHIFLKQGASAAVHMIMDLLVAHENVGVLIPIPQYPLYSATLTLLGGKSVPYYLVEQEDWALSIPSMKTAVLNAREKGIDVRAVVVINPGNPTGNCLSEENLIGIIKFCKEENLVLLADEVYQTNIYKEDRPFISAKKILRSLGNDYSNVELFSFHSTSKGLIGECGRRGGYVECTNVDEQVIDQIYKYCTVSLCPNVQGQIMVDLMVNPPKEGDASYNLFAKESSAIYTSLARRAEMLAEGFRKMEGVTCQPAQGAMYLFPRIRFPKKFLDHSASLNKQPDVLYCLELLNATGVCLVPGCGFGQEEGTFHFRSTFLPPEEEFESFIERIQTFHRQFMENYQ